MKTLDEAWQWYEAARINLLRIQRLAIRHWDDPSLQDVSIWLDNSLKKLEAKDLERQATRALGPLEDLGILVLFSVFEAVVRDHLEEALQPLTGQLGHPIFEQAAQNALEGIRQGSFANQVLKPLQTQRQVTPELSDRVKQLRDYRNWIAHGRREPRGPRIIRLDARGAYERLREFLNVLGVATGDESEQSGSDESASEELEG